MSETINIPTTHAARLRTAESLRAELAGAKAEIASLREQVDTAAWERDAAQQESAFLREEVLQLEPEWRESNPRIGLVLLTCDTWSDIPEPSNDFDEVALVSLSTGDIYVRDRGSDTWAKYGQNTIISDYANLGEKGPWITVGTSALHDHKFKCEAKRRFYSAKHDAQPYKFEWPDETIVQRVREALAKSSVEDPGPAISALGHLAGHTRAMWQQERDRQSPTHPAPTSTTQGATRVAPGAAAGEGKS